jgi:aspartate kinase
MYNDASSAMSGPLRTQRPARVGPSHLRPAREVVVCKFGGTSVGNLDRMSDLAARLVAWTDEGRAVVAVLSAMADCTDRLVELAHRIAPCPQPRELDALLSIGESLSCAVAALAINARGARAISMTAAQAGVRTDGAHGCARLREIHTVRVLEALDAGQIVLVTGFQGISPTGDVTTLGRGGSDASAVALAVALGVRRCEIFTDVAGVFTADPRHVPDARLLPVLSYEEMLQLAASGAGVMQARAVELAMHHDTEIHVRSAFTSSPGTVICKEDPVLEDLTIVGVAHRDRDPVYTVRDVTAAALGRALADRGVALGGAVTHGADVSFTVPGGEQSSVLAAIDSAGGRAVGTKDLGSVTAVGTGVGSRPELAAQGLAALDRLGISPELITATTSGISWHVPRAAVRAAARALHEAFGLREPVAAAAA